MKRLKTLSAFYVVMISLFICVGSSLLKCNNVYAASAPVVFFSDLDWGPKTGWEGSTTKGAAVSIWGQSFGATRGTSYVTINGAQVTEYAEWDAIGPARGLERITFWVPSTAADGAGQITVTVNGVTSNSVPFTVMAGKIYFISVTDGSNSNNGLYSTVNGSNGPFKDIDMFNPEWNPSGESISYICYVKGGTYTKTDRGNDPGSYVDLRGPYGSPSNRHALVGYPGETPQFTDGLNYNADYDPYRPNSYFTYSKLTGIGGSAAFDVFGDYNRIVGCTMKDYLNAVWTGVVWITASKQAFIYGNLFDHNGYDSYKHNIYIKTQPGASVDRSTQYIYVGWNEFGNPVANDVHGGVIFVSKSSDDSVDSMPTQNIYVHDNYFHDGNEDFIYIGDNVPIGDVYIYNNIFKGGASSNGCMTLQQGTGNVYLYNNIFYQCGISDTALILQMALPGYSSHSYFSNNIWFLQAGQIFFYVGASQGATMSSDHDLFYGPSGEKAPSGSGITVTNPVIGDPRFVANGSDFHLQASSPAINAGTPPVSVPVITDYDGLFRPQGSVYDIGAFEYNAGPVKLPSAPTNLRVQ